MGLVGRALLALWLGAPLILMPPEAFLASPVRWLRAITRYGGVLSGGPDFAFALCAQKIPASERAGLDLKTWRLALNASEPVRAATLQQFAAAYGPCGLPADALRPAYGLAEGVAIVTGGRPAQVQAFDRFALEQGDVHPVSAEAPRTRRLVSCGVPPPGACLLIVDPETRRVAAPNVVGEVWLSGPNVAAGYWRRPAETEEIFRAHLADGAGPFLRTGDLGFVFQDLLYLCGRRKDLILLHGRNCAPEDVEETATASEARLRPGGGAAFTIEVGEAERLVIMHEVRGPLTAEAAAQVIGAIRRAVARQHGLRAYAVSLLAPRALPKTSSGKVQRRACRAAFLAGQLPALAEWRAPPD
jgi:acyl-CoA synthetase (AMP-forming)/AMP-acid ligase II